MTRGGEKIRIGSFLQNLKVAGLNNEGDIKPGMAGLNALNQGNPEK
jgi:hypothetical protein